MLDALPARAGSLADAGDEMLDQHRFADTRFAADPHDRTPAAARKFPCLLEAGQSVDAPDKSGMVLGLGCRDARLRLLPADGRGFSDEAVSFSRNRFDQARTSRIVIECGAQIADRRFQHRFADKLMSPDIVEQHLFREQGGGLSRECT